MKGSLLIIDDEKQLTDNLQIILSKYADEVFVANSAQEGLRILQSENIHCVVCDIFMPEMSGLDLIKIVRESDITAPFIFFSAHNDEQLKSQVGQYDKTMFVTKPGIAELMAVLNPMLQLGMGVTA